MYQAKILLVEGKRTGQESFAQAIEKAGLRVKVVHTGAAALAYSHEHRPDLIIFDASAMRSSGARSCRRLRKELGEVPLIHCRARSTAEDRSTGADIYLMQPFTARKLLNRVYALLPADDSKEEVVRFGTLTFYRTKRSVDVNGQGERPLTPKLARLLEEFIRHPNEIVSRRQLMRNVWKTDYVGDTRTLDVHIRWTREYIEEDPARPQLLRTVRGKGYILAIPQPNYVNREKA